MQPRDDPTPSVASPAGAATLSRVLRLLKQHATCSTSFQILEPGYRYWFDGDDACVAFTDTGSAWVAAGAPVAACERAPEVARRFVEEATQAGRKARFFAVDEAFAQAAHLGRTHVGEEPYWDPSRWAETVGQSRSLREQLRRARAKGVRVREVSSEEIAQQNGTTRRGMERVIESWLHSRPMSEMGFMVLVHPFSFPGERRYVVAEREGLVLGFAVAVPVYAHEGWLVEDILRAPEAPNGTAEALVDAMMVRLNREGARYTTLGLAPLSGDVNPVLRFTRRYTASLYNFGGVRAFKAKLKPQDWEPVYLAYPRDERGILAVRDVLAAFAPGGLVRFSFSTLLHQRTLATAVLASLLVPWTLLLALVDGAAWFPSPWAQYGWVAFDSILIVLLAGLVHRWRSSTATLLTVLTTLDAGLTLAQVVHYNLARCTAWWHYLLAACAVAGPLMAACFFWSARLVAVRSKRPVASGKSLPPGSAPTTR